MAWSKFSNEVLKILSPNITEHSIYSIMCYVYVILNQTTKETYIGYSNDLRRRLREHKSKNPELIYYEAHKSEKDARGRERQLKKRGQAIRWLKERLKYGLKE